MAEKSALQPKTLLHSTQFWLGLALSVAAVYLAVRDVRWPQVMAALRDANVLLLLLALGSVVASTIAKAVRWRLLFYPRDRDLSLRRCLSVFLIGQLVNNLLPARSGDLLRAFLIDAGAKVGKALALTTVVVEKALDSVMLLLLIALISLARPIPSWVRHSSLLVSAVLGLLLLGVMLMTSHRQRVVHWLESLRQRYPWLGVTTYLQRLIEESGEVGALHDTRIQARLWATSALIWCLGIVTNALVFWAVGLHLEPVAPVLLLVVIMAGAVLPTSPLQLGVFHYLCLLTLSLFGVEQSIALSFSVLLHLVVYLPILVGGSLGLWKENIDLRQSRTIMGADANE